MPKITFDGLSLENQKEFVGKLTLLIQEVLNEHKENLSELIITNDMQKTLKKKMQKKDYIPWSKIEDSNCGVSNTLGQTIILNQKKQKYSIAVLFDEKSKPFINQIAYHELLHIKDFIIYNNYIQNNKLLSREQHKILERWYFLLIEYEVAKKVALKAEELGESPMIPIRKISSYVSRVNDFITNEYEIGNEDMSEKYGSLINAFFYEFVTYMGTMDGLGFEQKFNEELKTESVEHLFDDYLIQIASFFRNCNHSSNFLTQAYQYHVLRLNAIFTTLQKGNILPII